METFEVFKERAIQEEPGTFRLSNTYFRKAYHAEYGVWPEEADNLEAKPKGIPIRVRNTHSTLDGLAAFISAVGWITVVGGVVIGVVGMIYGGAVAITGLLVVANGQLLKVISQVEQNTQKSSLLLEKILDKVGVDD